MWINKVDWKVEKWLNWSIWDSNSIDEFKSDLKKRISRTKMNTTGKIM